MTSTDDGPQTIVIENQLFNPAPTVLEGATSGVGTT